MPQITDTSIQWPRFQSPNQARFAHDFDDRRLLSSRPRQSQHFPSRWNANQGALLEMGEMKSQKEMLIAFRIPEAPYSDEAFKWLHKSIDVVDAVHVVAVVFEVPLAGLLGVAVEVVAPILAGLGSLALGGAAYAEARAKISKDRIRTGFALGFVTGADRRPWPYVKRLFWEYRAETNTFDPGAGRVAQRAFNTGLAAGFLQGRQIVSNPSKMAFFWKSLSPALTRGDRMQFSGKPDLWPESVRRDWYYWSMGAFSKLYLKD
jgi:hypothetical protein